MNRNFLVRPSFHGKPKFSAGHRVRVKTKAELIEMGFVEVHSTCIEKGNQSIVSDMVNYLGKIVTIKDMDDTLGYDCRIVECEGMWHTDWFEPLGEFKINVHKSSVREEATLADMIYSSKTFRNLAMSYNFHIGLYMPKYKKRKAKLKASKDVMTAYTK